MPRRQYRNPPIREATCEFRFAPSNEWNLTYPGIFAERVRTRYPGKPKELKQLTVETSVSEGAKSAPPSVIVKEELTKVQLTSDDGKELVAVGPDVLSVHVLRPYAGWETFRPRIEEALQHYCDVLSPAGIRRAGIRYINQLDISDDKVPLEELFRMWPREWSDLRCQPETFVNRTEYIHKGDPIRMVITFARSFTSESKSSVLLDIDTYLQWPGEPLDIDQAMAKVDMLRDREREAFEAYITDRARELFDAE